MLGYIVYPAARFGTEEFRLAGAAFLRVELPARRPWRMERLIRRAVRRLGERGVRRAVFPVDFPYTASFAGRGVLPVSDLALRRAVAAETLLCRMAAAGEDPRRSAAALLAAAPTGEVGRLLRELAPRVRYLSLWAGAGSEGLAADLRWELGLALRVAPPPELFRGAEGALLLREPPPEAPLPAVSLPLWEGSRGDLTPYFSLPPAEGSPAPDQLLGALFAAGGIKKEDFSPPCG